MVNIILTEGYIFMFWYFGRPRSLVSVSNLNDIYLGTINEVGAALGRRPSRLVRNRHTKKMFVINFEGDAMASSSKALSHEITSILCNAQSGDEVLVKITSPGGAAYAYGYAASQLERLRKHKIPLTVSIDKVAASGGYLMACVADKIISAPWAVVGSIGVVAEMPNLFEFLQRLGIDYRQYTAGEFKRTVSMLGRITEKGERKFEAGLHDMHSSFKRHIVTNRPALASSIDDVSTGEHWSGVKALELGLVDEVLTSEEYILAAMKDSEVIQIRFRGERKTLAQKIGTRIAYSFASGFMKSLQDSFSSLILRSKFN